MAVGCVNKGSAADTDSADGHIGIVAEASGAGMHSEARTALVGYFAAVLPLMAAGHRTVTDHDFEIAFLEFVGLVKAGASVAAGCLCCCCKNTVTAKMPHTQHCGICGHPLPKMR